MRASIIWDPSGGNLDFPITEVSGGGNLPLRDLTLSQAFAPIQTCVMREKSRTLSCFTNIWYKALRNGGISTARTEIIEAGFAVFATICAVRARAVIKLDLNELCAGEICAG